MPPSTAIRAGDAAGIKPWLFSVATRVVLCCNDMSADLLLQGLDVGAVLQDGQCYFWELQRVCFTGEKGSKSWHCVCRVASVSVLVRAHLPRELQMYAVIPGQACGSAFKSLVIYKEKPKRNSSCITGFSNACVKLACVRLAGYFLLAGVDFPLSPPTVSSYLVVKFLSGFLRTSPDLDWKPVFLQCTVQWWPSLSAAMHC